MPDLTGNSPMTRVPPVFEYSNIGTAAGTTTLTKAPAFIHSVTITKRAASGKVILYDSAGTSGTVVGTINLGTQTFSDPVTVTLDVRTINALTVANDADLGCIVSFGK